MIRLGLFMLMVMFFVPSSLGQKQVWILGGKRDVPPPFKKWKPELVFDARNSWIGAQQVKLGGVRIGLELNRVHRFGIGIYGLNNPLTIADHTVLPDGIGQLQYQFGYNSLFYERVLYFSRKWEVNTTLHAGNGRIEIFAQDKGKHTWYAYQTIDVKPMEGSITAYYHLTWWMSLGGGVGYRYLRKAPIEVEGAYNNTVYVARLKIRLGRMLKSIWNKEAKNEY